MVMLHPAEERITGRPTKLTDAVATAVIDNIREGLYFQQACEAAGITASSVYRWLKKARSLGHDDGGCDEACADICALAQAIKMAEAEAEQKALKHILADNRWESRAWYLERRHPQRWAKRSPHEANPDGDDVLQGKVTSEQLQAMAMGVLQTIGAAAVLEKIKLAAPGATSVIAKQIPDGHESGGEPELPTVDAEIV